MDSIDLKIENIYKDKADYINNMPRRYEIDVRTNEMTPIISLEDRTRLDMFDLSIEYYKELKRELNGTRI